MYLPNSANTATRPRHAVSLPPSPLDRLHPPGLFTLSAYDGSSFAPPGAVPAAAVLRRGRGRRRRGRGRGGGRVVVAQRYTLGEERGKLYFNLTPKSCRRCSGCLLRWWCGVRAAVHALCAVVVMVVVGLVCDCSRVVFVFSPSNSRLFAHTIHSRGGCSAMWRVLRWRCA